MDQIYQSQVLKDVRFNLFWVNHEQERRVDIGKGYFTGSCNILVTVGSTGHTVKVSSLDAALQLCGYTPDLGIPVFSIPALKTGLKVLEMRVEVSITDA